MRRSIRMLLEIVAILMRPCMVLAAFGLLMMLEPVSMAQTNDSKPEELGKQRSALYLKATQSPLENLSGEVNRVAVLSETCRVKYGSAPCGLPDKALESDKLEERYAYYVKQPVEAHTKTHAVKIDRRNWEAADSPPHP